jgi:hypothetical protein
VGPREEKCHRESGKEENEEELMGNMKKEWKTAHVN